MPPFLSGLFLDRQNGLRSGWRATLFLLGGQFAATILALPVVLVQGLAGRKLPYPDVV